MDTRSTTSEHPDVPALSGRYDDEALDIKPTKTEIAGQALIDYIAEMRGNGIKVDSMLIDLADKLEDAINRAQASVIPVPRLLEVTGNVSEGELAARLMEAKMRGALRHADQAGSNRHEYEHIAECFRVAATDFRAGLHLPEVMIEGKVIPYNEDNDTGIRHADALRAFFTDVHERNVKAGWWSDIETGLPKKRSPGELLILMVTEMAEAYDAWLDRSADDKLPQYPGFGVEMADLGIRFADFCGALLAGRIIEPDPAHNPGDAMFREILVIARRYESIRKTPAAVGDPETADFMEPQDVAEMTDAKLAFNAVRPDHKIAARLADDGKKT